VWFLEAGSCTHPEATVIAGGARTSIRFGSSVAVIEHPREGVVLFDTGYSPRFHQETARFPYSVYGKLTPVDVCAETTAVEQLRARGIAPDDVRAVVLSHFHADHCGGVADFPRARYVYRQAAWEAVRGLGPFGATRAGFLPGLLPADFEARSAPLAEGGAVDGAGTGPFRAGWDLFGDESMVLVDLPGHVRGHSGAFVRAADGREYFLVADACWLSRAFRELRMPHLVTALIMHSRKQYRATLEGIHRLATERPDLHVVPCHCAEAFATLPRDRPAT
jgi:glyoxylase-like metal-dependent hydrolase (beta-lactamase superfamily II)